MSFLFWKQQNQNNSTVINSVTTTPKTKNTIEVLWRLQKIILDTLDFNLVVQRIVDSLLSELGYLNLGYKIIVLTLVDPQKQVLRRISLSNTSEAEKALAASAVPFHDIDIPLDAHDNLLIKTLLDKKPHTTHYWPDIFNPVLSTEEALNNQKAAAIKTSMLYPIVVKEKAIGVLIFSLVKDEKEVSEEEKELIGGFTDIVGLAVQNSELYSHLQEMTKNLENANTRLKELDVLKNEFVSVASHELRTPMTAIKSYLWMTLNGRGGELTEKQKFYIERAYGSVDRLIKLVNDMLNISRIESGRLTITMNVIDVVKLTQDVIDEILPRAKELGVTIEIQHISPPPKVIADSDKIKEVLFNLIGNSLKFTPKDGKISITFSQNGEMIETKIKDTGTGIEAEDIPKLFQKFALLPGSYETNQSAGMGTGLGLYICRAIIELHKGKVWVSSEGRGKGSEFTFSLKVASDTDIQAQNGKHPDETKGTVELIHTQI